MQEDLRAKYEMKEKVKMVMKEVKQVCAFAANADACSIVVIVLSCSHTGRGKASPASQGKESAVAATT